MAALTLDQALELATGHFQAGRTDAAKAVLDAILGEAPDCADAHNLLGLTAHKSGALEAALASIGEAVRLVPEDANYISNLGVVHKTKGDLDQAGICFRRAIELEPEKPSFHFNLGQTLYQGGRDRDAMAALQRAVGLAPDYVNALNELGNCLRDIGRADRDLDMLRRGLDCFTQIAAIQPDFRGLAWCRFRVLREQARLALDGGSDTSLAICRECEDVLAAADWLPAGKIFADGGANSSLEIFDIATAADGSFGPAAVKPYQNARLLPGDKEWFLIDEGVIHLTDMANTTPETGPYVIAEGARQAVLRIPGAVHRISHNRQAPLFLIGGSRNYYHWMLDYLPRLMLAGADMRLLVNEVRAPFQDECFALLGIDADRLVVAPDGVQIVCDELQAAAIPVRQMRLDGAALAWLRGDFAAKALSGAGDNTGAGAPTKRRLYVSRKDASLRRVVNEAEVLDALEPLGFELVIGGDLSVAGQVRLFSGADIVVAPHGAALTNLVFTDPGALLVELSAAQRVQYSFFRQICQDCGHDFALLQCGAVPSPEQTLGANNQDHDMHVPVDQLLGLLRERL
jgi:tetratricopeptide (TPR) repeat protein